MPRPTPAQLAYGSSTVVLSTLAMLLLSGVRSGFGVVAITVAGLVLGLLVGVTVTTFSRTAAPESRTVADAPRPIPRARVHSAAEQRLSEPSVRR